MARIKLFFLDYLKGGADGKNTKEEVKKIMLINLLGGIAIVFLSIFSIIDSFQGNLLSIAHTIGIVLLIFALFFLRKPERIIVSSNLVILVLMLVTLSSVIFGRENNPAIFWIYVFPIVAYFLVGFKKAKYWMLIVFGVFFILLTLKFLGIKDLPYDYKSMLVAFSILALVTGLIYLDQSTKKEVIESIFRESSRYKEINKELRKEILERKAAEEEVLEENQNFRDLFNNMGSGAVIYKAVKAGEDFLIKDMNKASQKIEKVDKDKVLGKSIVKVFPGVKDFGLFDILKKVWKHNKSENQPATYYKDNRILGWRKNNVFKLRSGEVVTIYDDLTEEKEKEHQLQETLDEIRQERDVSISLAKDLSKFQLAVENVGEQIIITDANGIVVYANKATEEITGFLRKEIIGEKAGTKDLWGGLMDKKYYKEMWDRISKDKEPYVGEINNKKKDGVEYIAAISINPILDEDGEVKFFVGIERDITKAKEVDRMKTEFISVASHQLRTPLSAIKWFVEMLKNKDAGQLTTDQEKIVRDIYDSNERMIDLVNSLLNISRIESGRIIIDPEPTNLKDLVRGVLKELEVKRKAKDQTINFSGHNDLPEISIDPKLIRNVYLNLISNAIKYTSEKGEITILISQSGDEIISQITDNGLGIPEKDQEKVFKKFFRGENIVRYETDGTGLGLYLVKAIIKSSGGRIWFESKEDEGTTFWFALPLKGSPAKKGEVTIDT